MKIYCENKSQLAQSVGHIARGSNPNSQLTMIIRQEKSGDFYVIDVTSSVLAETEEKMLKHLSESFST